MNRGGINHWQIKMVNLTSHWHVYVIISPWNIIELCRISGGIQPQRNNNLWHWKLRTQGTIAKKSIILNFDDNWRQWWACGCRHLSLQLFIMHRSMSLGHLCCHSLRNNFLYHQRKNVPGSQLLSYRFATSENVMLQVRADFFRIWILLIPLLNGTHMRI